MTPDTMPMSPARRPLLGPEQREVLGRVAGRDALLAFDFDGTLAPIVDRPEDATMRRETRALLSDLSRHRAVAVISGRAVADVRPRLRGVRTVAIIGNHGIEPSVAMAETRAEVLRWGPRIVAQVGGEPGVRVEEKGHSIAVHYRHAPDPDMVRRKLDDVLASLGADVRRIEGISAVNLVPARAPTKGDALRQLQAVRRAPAVLYVGDEATDEDAFAVLDPAASVAVRVGRHAESCAPWYLEHQGEVDRMLGSLLERVAERTLEVERAPGRRRGVPRVTGALASAPASLPE